MKQAMHRLNGSHWCETGCVPLKCELKVDCWKYILRALYYGLYTTFALRGASCLVLACSFGLYTTVLILRLHYEALHVWSCPALCLCVSSVLLAFWSPCLGKRELVFMFIVHLFVSYAHVNLCHFSLPPDVGGWLRLLLVAVPGLFCLLFVYRQTGVGISNNLISILCAMLMYIALP